MRKLTQVVLLSLLVGALCSCTISGTITDPDGHPVAGVTVGLTGPLSMETTTNASGFYAFTHSQITQGDFVVTPISDAYVFEPADRPVAVAGNNVSGVDFSAIARTPCQTNEGCNADAYCRKAISDCGGDGYCDQRPQDYIRLWAPICGCDNLTHASAHDAAVDGVSVLHEGECELGDPTQISEAKSSLERDLTPDISKAEVDTLVAGNTDFAVALYRQIYPNEAGNIFYSPYSISTALAMLYAGAAGNTQQQMADCLRLTLPRETLHSGFNYLALALESRGQDAAGADGGKFRLNIANALWAQKDFSLLPAYLDILAVNYDAGMNLLDFILYPEPSRLTINQWVAEQTEERIKDLLPQGSITTDTRLVLTNAVYFNAAWLRPFTESNTRNEPFYRLDNSEVLAAMMHQTEYFKYVRGDGYQAVEIPYDGNELSMVIIVPAEGRFNDFEAALQSQTIGDIIGRMGVTYVNMALPQWEYKSKFGLGSALDAMGMTDAFSPSVADFSGINGGRDLFVQGVVHEAFVKVNEAGTEAAAATGIIVGITSIPPTPRVVRIDRPFIYLIRDIPTQTVLFAGRVVDPTQ